VFFFRSFTIRRERLHLTRLFCLIICATDTFFVVFSFLSFFVAHPPLIFTCLVHESSFRNCHLYSPFFPYLIRFAYNRCPDQAGSDGRGNRRQGDPREQATPAQVLFSRKTRQTNQCSGAVTMCGTGSDGYGSKRDVQHTSR
jgi:hypothetical protein